MSRFSYTFTQEKIEMWLKEGRGKGEGKDYKPWLTVYDFPSKGLVSREKGIKTGRLHHVMSDGEDRCLNIFSLSKKIIDIREQYPLLPLTETEKIAQLLNIKHPTSPDTQIHIVMTTDFYLTIQNPNEDKYFIARTVKTKSDLNSYRTIEKLEIERIYWESHSIDWGIIISDMIPQYFGKNSQELAPYYLAENLEILQDDLEDIYIQLTQVVMQKKRPLRINGKEIDRKLGLPLGTSMKAAKHFIANQKWGMDWKNKFDPNRTLEILFADESYS